MKTGQVYTPPKLADLIIQLTFVDKLYELKKSFIQDKINEQRFNQTFKDFKHLNILDPACGTGIFLISAYKYLKNEFSELLEKKQIEESKRTIIRDFIENIPYSLYGVDVDKLAVEEARNNLQNEILSSILDQQIQVADFLDESITSVFQKWKKTRFQYIIGNPPFIDILNLTKAQKARLRSNFKSLRKRFDLYIPFLEQAINFLESNGTIVFILPSSILYESYAGKIRKLILERLNIKYIYDLSKFNLFPVAVRTICIILEQRKENFVNHKIKILQPSINPLKDIKVQPKQFFIPQTFFNRTYDHQFRLVEETTREISEKILARSIKLGTIFVTAWGARGTPIKDFHFNRPINNKCQRLIKGEDIIASSPFPHVRYQNRWLLYDRARLYRPSFPSLFTQKKLVIRKVTGSAGLIAALDTDFFYTDDSVICGVLKNQLAHIPTAELSRHKIACTKEEIALSKSYSLEFILALLNSDVGQFYFNNFLSHKLNVYPKLVEEFPVPSVEKQSSLIKETSDKLNLLLETLDRANRKTKDLLQIKRQIDELILTIYDFSEAQKQIIQLFQSPGLLQ